MSDHNSHSGLCGCPIARHDFRSARGILLGGVCVYPSRLQAGWVHYEVLRATPPGAIVYFDLVDIAEGEAPSEAEAVRVAKFLVER